MMKIGINLDAFRDEPLKNIIPEVKKMGIHYVELWASNMDSLDGGKTHKWSYYNKDIAKAKRELDEAGLQVQIVVFGFGLDAECCQDIPRFQKELIHTIEIAKEFNAPYVIHHVRDIRRQDELDLPLLHRYYDAPVKKAEELGVTLLLENQCMDMTYTPENVLKLMQEFHSPCFQANFDASNFFLGGNEPWPHCYEMLKPYLKHVHIKNLVSYDPAYCPSQTLIGLDMTHKYAGQKAYRVRLAEGVLNNEGFLAALHRDGFDGVVSLENHGTHQEMFDMCSADAEYMRKTGFFEE